MKVKGQFIIMKISIIISLLIISLFATFFVYKKRRYENKKIENLLQDFNRFEIVANVFFGLLHKLKGRRLKVFIKEEIIFIVGFDHYRGRFTNYVFTNNTNITQKTIKLPVYYIENIFCLNNIITIQAIQDFKLAKIEVLNESDENQIEKLFYFQQTFYGNKSD